jgi:hypothetical protein
MLKWATVEDKVLEDALKYRWTHDARLRKIVQATKIKEKRFLLHSWSWSSILGGIRKANTGMIQGERRLKDPHEARRISWSLNG